MVDYELLQGPFSEAFIDELHVLGAEVFGELARDDLAWRLRQMPCVSVLVAREGPLVGFKLGYAVASDRYHSWLGGVRGPWRRKGIARELMLRQHDWLREQGFASVETSAVPANGAMLGLNLRSGFRVIGSYQRGNQVRVTLAKALNP